MQQVATFIDRDGVIAESRQHPGAPQPPASIDDVLIPDGVEAALGALRAAGYIIIAVTNQPGVARGTTSRSSVEKINTYLKNALPIEAMYTCFHDGDSCACRKPRPGLILEAGRDYELDLNRSWLIGDRWVDVAAGRAAGVRTVLLERSYSWSPTHQGPPPLGLQPDAVGADISACAAAIRDSGPGFVDTSAL